MNEQVPNHRWFRFGLRTFFVVVTVFGIWLGWQLNVVRHRREMAKAMDEANVFLTSSPRVRQAILDYYARNPERPRKSLSIPYYRRWLGDEATFLIAVSWTPYEVDQVAEVFPEAEVVITWSWGFPE